MVLPLAKPRPLILLLVLCLGCTVPTRETDPLRDIRNTTVIPEVGSYDPAIQKQALQRIFLTLEQAPEITCNLLAATLRDPVVDDRTKLVICWILASEEDPRAIPTLMELLGRVNEDPDQLIKDSLATFGSRIVSGVAQVLEGGSDLARLAAAEVLLEIAVPEAHAALVSRYPLEEAPQIRFLILCGAAEDPSNDASEVLISGLDDAERQNREIAWEALRRKIESPSLLRFDAGAGPEVRRSQVTELRRWLASSRRL
ncbi:MAG TPA: hypothetical protein EYN79_01685 [Planctomycetes bacterium]|nr:hypothetical protein [Planctomycetota bacterium]HIN79766.1 hypothetical protein [Planctomycetota bacterium]